MLSAPHSVCEPICHMAGARLVWVNSLGLLLRSLRSPTISISHTSACHLMCDCAVDIAICQGAKHLNLLYCKARQMCVDKSLHLHQKDYGKWYVFHSLFYPLQKQWYIIAVSRISSPKVHLINRRLYHFRNDDIQNFVLMICNFCEIDDIQGSRLDFDFTMTKVFFHYTAGEYIEKMRFLCYNKLNDKLGIGRIEK